MINVDQRACYLVRQIKSQWSKKQADAPKQAILEPLEQAGLLNKEPTGPLRRLWVMGPLEQAGAPDLEPMEPHGASRGSRSKDYGPLELGALNQESMGSFGFHSSWSWMEPYIKNQLAPRAGEVPKSRVNEALLEDGAP